jgi:hypothetical protein
MIFNVSGTGIFGQIASASGSAGCSFKYRYGATIPEGPL